MSHIGKKATGAMHVKFSNRSSTAMALISMALGFGSAHAVDGELDPTFGQGGKLNIALDLAKPYGDIANALVVKNDHSYLIGSASTPGGNAPYILRLTANGMRDSSYDGDGVRIIDDLYGIYDSYAFFAAAFQNDGKLLLAGNATLGANTDMLACRFLANGNLDMAFGDEQGCRRIKFDLTPNGFDSANAIVIKPNGRILLAGVAYGANSIRRMAVAQLNAVSALDEGFGEGDGRVDLNFPQWKNAEAKSILFDRQGRILVGGTISNFGQTDCDSDMAVIRLGSNGVIDQNYANLGRSRIGFDLGPAGEPCAHWQDAFVGMALDAKGALYVGGGAQFSNQTDHVIAVAKLTPQGSYDNSFGTLGKATHYVCDVCASTSITGFLRRPDGKMIFTGSTSPGTLHPQMFMMRLSKNGEYERGNYVGFDTAPTYDDSDDYPLAIATQHGRTLIVGGTIRITEMNNPDTVAVRIDDDYIFFNDLE